MADIRINALATTAASTASDDFIAVDGSANGTRKLNAFSPTFGGNLTVSGAGNSSVAGNLGIGETSPVVPLHVKTTGTGTGDFDNAIATLRSTAAGRTITLQFSDTTNQSYISSKSGALNFGVGGATLGMSLSSGGNLTVSGTGNSSIAGNLLFNTSTARGILTINKTASDTLSTANAAAFIGQPDNLEAGLLMQQTATTPYSFVLQGRSPSGTYQFPISLNPQGGNVLIGTTADNSLGKLQVSGDAAVTSAIPRIYLNRNGGYVWSVLQSDGTGSLGDISTLNFVNNGNVSKFSLTDAGNATFAGNVGIGGTTPTASGKGITFPATQSPSTDANTLDDYEEGPCSLSVSAGTGTITSYTITAYYTKIGRLVMINGYLEITNNGTGAGYLSITGLPFTSGYYASSGSREGGTHGLALSMIMNPSTTTINVYKYDNSYPVATGSNVPFTFSYMV